MSARNVMYGAVDVYICAAEDRGLYNKVYVIMKVYSWHWGSGL